MHEKKNTPRLPLIHPHKYGYTSLYTAPGKFLGKVGQEKLLKSDRQIQF